MIRDPGFDGAGVRFIDSSFATEVTSFPRTQANSLLYNNREFYREICNFGARRASSKKPLCRSHYSGFPYAN
jgi:hypothetical protein